MQQETYTLGELAKHTNSTLIGDSNYCISGVEELSSAQTTDVSFLSNPKYIEAMKKSLAGAVFVDASQERLPGKNYLITDHPSRAFQSVCELFYDAKRDMSGFTDQIHPSAVIHPTAEIGEGVKIGPNVTIDQHVKIGKQTEIHPNVTLGAYVSLGEACVIYSNTHVRSNCQIGNRVTLQPGAIIGSCGFGYTPNEKGEHTKLKQIGGVVIEDDVEIGANTCIDRGRFKPTVIGRGTKIDNLVQIGHNVRLGQHNIIIAQTGIAGSSSTGKYVMMGGQCGVVGHVHLGDFVRLATRSGVSKSLLTRGDYRGSPAQPITDFNRFKVMQRKIPSILARLKELEQALSKTPSIN